MADGTFAHLPDEARLWVLALDRPARGEALVRLQAGLAELLGTWRHKGHAYQAAWELREGRLLLVAEPGMASAPSGCAIDGMLRKLGRLVVGLGFALEEDRLLVRVEGEIRPIAREEVPLLLEEGGLDGATPVLDLSLTTLRELRDGRLERPLAQTWVGRKFRVARSA